MVRNARAKINRLEKQFGADNLKKSGINLRDEIMPTPKIDQFETRKEFNAWKEQQRDFTNRNNIDYKYEMNEHKVVVSRRKLKKAESVTKIARRKAQGEIDRLESLPFHHRGEEHGTVGERAQHMKEGTVTGVRLPNEFDFDKVTYASRVDNVINNMEKRLEPEYYDERMQRLQDNFISALSGSFHSEADQLVDLIKSVPANHFYDLWLGETDMEFSNYDSDGQEVTATTDHVERITNYVLAYKLGQAPGRENNDLRDF